jgi:hypothetical protein
MKVDNQAASHALESKDELGNHGQQALAAVFAHNRDHVVGSVPKRARDEADPLPIVLKNLAADEILHEEISASKRREGLAGKVQLLARQRAGSFSRFDSLEANQKLPVHGPARDDLGVSDFLTPRKSNLHGRDRHDVLGTLDVEGPQRYLPRGSMRAPQDSEGQPRRFHASTDRAAVSPGCC